MVWAINHTGALPNFPLPDGIVIYEPVSLDMETPYPLPGEKVTLPLPENIHVQVRVTTSHLNPNGDYSWRGHLDGQGDNYPATMTFGQRAVFATVTTPQGSYALETINGRGWVYKNPAEIELSQPGAEDFMEIPEKRN